MKSAVALPIIATFIITVITGPFFIPFLRKLKFGQTVRNEGPESHKAKTGTPPMGGLMFLSAILIVSLFYMKDFPEVVPVILLAFGFGFVGFIDDYIKVVKKQSMGLRPWQKMALQIAITGLFAFYITNVLDLNLAMKIPFLKNQFIDLGFFNLPLLFLVVIGTDTGTNFTDGIDGLCSSVTIVVALFMTIAVMRIDGQISPASLVFIGGLMGFLVYNAYPAKVFMGDTGALALGGYVAAMAYIYQLQLFLVIIGVVYVWEVLSVIMQVSYFKLTKGKRIFKMTPIHHHFELCGWSETKVVTVFTIVTVICCAIALDGLW